MFKRSINLIAELALQNVKNKIIIGLGSGATVALFTKMLGKYIKKQKFDIMVIPSSIQILIIAEKAGLTTTQLIDHIDLVVDGADIIDKDYNMIKGGGGALFKEKILMNAGKKVIVLADESKFVNILDKPIPVEVNPFSRSLVIDRLLKMDAHPKLRVLKKGFPYITENGNLILDVDFGLIREPMKLEKEIKLISGVVEVGLFTNKINIFYKANVNGTTQIIEPLKT